MKRLHILTALLILLFSCGRSRSAKEFFDLACEYENNAEIELAMATYKQTIDAAKSEGDTARSPSRSSMRMGRMLTGSRQA